MNADKIEVCNMKNNFIQKSLASLMLAFTTSRRQKADSERMEKLDFSTNTKDMGLRFNDKIRNSWRRRWIKLKK